MYLWVTETKVWNCNTAWLLGVIIKICLSIHICVVTDNLDRVLVSTNSTVRTKSPELTACNSFRSCYRWRTCRKWKISYIIVDTDCKSLLLCVIVYCDNLCRCCILRTKSVTSCKYRNVSKLCILNSCNNIKVKRLTDWTRFLGSVKYGNLLNCLKMCIRDKNIPLY